MSRLTQDREDLLHEATALVPRLLLHLEMEDRAVEIFAGFRCGNALSIYFDSDPVYHFNNYGQLRRAYLGGNILKADHGQLVAWDPHRTSESVSMSRHELSDVDQEQLVKELLCKLKTLKRALAEQAFTLVGQFPAEGDGLERLNSWLESSPGFSVAASPNIC